MNHIVAPVFNISCSYCNRYLKGTDREFSSMCGQAYVSFLVDHGGADTSALESNEDITPKLCPNNGKIFRITIPFGCEEIEEIVEQYE
jgi:hypothetical protein